ncbi:MAG: myo-inosose-2 dehydratase [Fastidiosipilaceae bacterium]|jgi:inosose dehydratase
MLNPDNVKLGIAPIGWTNDDLPELGKENTFQQCVSEMALAGFTGSEVGGKYPSDPAILKPMLDIRGIQICNQWFSLFSTTKSLDENIKAFKEQLSFLKAMGATVIGASEQGNSIQGKPVPIFDEKPVFTDEQWKVFADTCNTLGQIAKDEGMKFTYHHHMGTGVQTEAETDKFLEMTDPDLVYLLFDSGHFTFSGEDAAEMLEKYIDRVGHVHLKDVRMAVRQEVMDKKMSFLEAVAAGTFTVPGDGDVDFTSIFDVLAKYDYKGWVVVEAEQDPAKANPFEYALKARNYIREKTGL